MRYWLRRYNMSRMSQLDAHQKPPDRFRSLFKRYQKLGLDDLEVDDGIIDISRGLENIHDQLRSSPESFKGDRERAFRDFLRPTFDEESVETDASMHVYEVEGIPGQLSYLHLC